MQCDVFVFFDNAIQPLGKSYVSRNEVRTAQGRQWLTVPISKKSVPIAQTTINDRRWPEKHIRTLENAYGRSEHISVLEDRIAPVLRREYDYIADMNIDLIQSICEYLEFNTRFLRATEMSLTREGAESIPEILTNVGATKYITGTGAGSRKSIEVGELEQVGIQVDYLETTFGDYCQFHHPFEPNLSILDALFCVGAKGTTQLLEGHSA